MCYAALVTCIAQTPYLYLQLKCPVCVLCICTCINLCMVLCAYIWLLYVGWTTFMCSYAYTHNYTNMYINRQVTVLYHIRSSISLNGNVPLSCFTHYTHHQNFAFIMLFNTPNLHSNTYVYTYNSTCQHTYCM